MKYAQRNFLKRPYKPTSSSHLDLLERRSKLQSSLLQRTLVRVRLGFLDGSNFLLTTVVTVVTTTATCTAAAGFTTLTTVVTRL